MGVGSVLNPHVMDKETAMPREVRKLVLGQGVRARAHGLPIPVVSLW